MSSKAMQARGMLLQSNDQQISIILLIKFDGSSKLCFEEKSNSAIGDKIFKKGWQLISSGAVMVSVAKFSIMQSLQKSVENFIVWAHNSEKKWKSGLY